MLLNESNVQGGDEGRVTWWWNMAIRKHICLVSPGEEAKQVVGSTCSVLWCAQSWSAQIKTEFEDHNVAHGQEQGLLLYFYHFIKVYPWIFFCWKIYCCFSRLSPKAQGYQPAVAWPSSFCCVLCCGMPCYNLKNWHHLLPDLVLSFSLCSQSERENCVFSPQPLPIFKTLPHPPGRQHGRPAVYHPPLSIVPGTSLLATVHTTITFKPLGFTFCTDINWTPSEERSEKKKGPCVVEG